MIARSIAILCPVLLALAGCQNEAKRATGGRAEGEILPGSVSDAMLPYDTVRSQPPLAPKAEGAEGKDKDKDRGNGGDDKPASKPEPSPVPAASAAEVPAE